jgi:uncharacterized protein YjbJ (UPF0337 family)
VRRVGAAACIEFEGGLMSDRELRREGRKDQVEGAIKEAQGDLRGDIGDAVDDHSEHLKGRAKQAEGKIQKKVGEIKEDLGKPDREDRV